MPAKATPHNFIYNDIKEAENYWNKLKPGPDVTVSYQEKWKMLTPFFEQISSQNSVLVLLADLLTTRFIYAIDKRNVVGYEPSLYIAEDGVYFSMSNAHPDFLSANLLMQQRAFEYMNQNKAQGLNKIIVNFDGMYKKRNGEYMHFLQQSVCIETNNIGQPLLALNYIYDITYLKKVRTANLVIAAPNEVKLWNFDFHNNNLEPVQPLSKQEKKVLAYLANRKSSKEMAKELSISSSTIDTHRRNLLKKTNCIDTTGLITYAKLVGLL